MKQLQRALLLFTALSATLSAANTFHVATNGNDAWSGTKAIANGQKSDGPFATPARARDAIRAAKAKGNAGPFAVELHGGKYELAETLAFTPADSGTKEAPVIWRSFAGERAILSGGKAIRGLSEGTHAGQRAWKTVIAEVREGKWFFRQLFVENARSGAVLRRFRPHLGMKLVAGLTDSPSRKAAPHRSAQRDFVFYPGDMKAWDNLSDVEIVALHEWSSSRLLIEKLDLENRVVTFTGLPTFRIGHWWTGSHNPYFIENVKEALAAPGEWYLDRKSGELTYLPMPGEKQGETSLVAPALDRIVSLTGDAAKGAFVANLIFSNLALMWNESPLPKEGYGGAQGHPELPAAVELVAAMECTFVECTIAHTGNYGIGIGQGCRGNRVVGCQLADLGGGGVKVGDSSMNAQAVAPVLPVDNSVENCLITDGGILYYSANAVWAGITRGTALLHNEISNFAYAGIAVGWNWSDTPTSCASNRIEYNHISHVCTLLADGASIYTLGRQPGTVIRGNLVRDNKKSAFAREHWQLGLYLDEGSSEMLVENNIVLNVGTHGFNVNGGANIIARNNILGPVYGKHGPYIRSAKKAFSKGMVFERNLIWCDSPNLADAPWAPDQMVCRSNLYFNTLGSNFNWTGKSWAEWQAMGQDGGSLLANPMFENAAKDDFRLKPGSPALRLGFKPFPITAGLEPTWKKKAARIPVSVPPVFAMSMPPIPESILAPRASATSIPVPRVEKAPDISADLSGWPAPISVNQTPGRDRISNAAPSMSLCCDTSNLYVAVSVPGDALKRNEGQQWGPCEGVEICLGNPRGLELERVYVLRGYVNGVVQSVSDGGANQEAASKLGEGVRHRALKGASNWVSLFSIPLAPLGIASKPGTRLAFNVCVRRPSTSQWILLYGTFGSSYQLNNAGWCELK